jgi:hypothetical protein
VNNSTLHPFFSSPEISFKESEPFQQFIRQLYENGMEICLNTPAHNTADRKLVEEALEKTRREFTQLHGLITPKKVKLEILRIYIVMDSILHLNGMLLICGSYTE